MDAWIVFAIVVAVLFVLGVGIWVLVTRRRRNHLQERFGPEYERTVAAHDKRREAEADLKQREERRDALDIRPLPEAARDRYLKLWHEIQERFVDTPSLAVEQADELVTEVMRERGYPMDDFEQRAADVSVDHPHVVESYRQAHLIRSRARQGESSTEDQRRAMVHYRDLFDDLLSVQQA